MKRNAKMRGAKEAAHQNINAAPRCQQLDIARNNHPVDTPGTAKSNPAAGCPAGSPQEQRVVQDWVRSTLEGVMKEIDAAAAAILNYFHVQVDPNAGTAEKLRVLESRQITTPLESLMEFTTTMSIFEATVKKGRFCVLQAEHAFGQYGEEAMPLEELKLYPELAQVAAELQRLLIWLNGDE